MTAPTVELSDAQVRARLRAIRRAVNDRKLATSAATRSYLVVISVAILVLTLAMLVFPFLAGAADRGLVTVRTAAGGGSSGATNRLPAGLVATPVPLASSSTAGTGISQPTPQHGTPGTAATTTATGGSVGDYAELELWGALGGLVGAVVALRRLRGSRRPPGLQIAQIVLKIPAGALLALFGVVLLQSGLLPLLTPAADGQLVAYAMLFGFVQETLTRAVDRHVAALLAKAG